MVGKLSRRLTFLFCCFFSSIGILYYGHESFSDPAINNVFSIFDARPKKLLEQNASGSWPNYKHIWEDFYGDIPSFYQCADYAKGNGSQLKSYYAEGRIPLEEAPKLLMECDHIRRRVMGNTIYNRLKHPYAIARNVYQNYSIQELLLAFSYSPSNIYCYAIDKKSQKSFKKDLKQLGNCLPNVFVLEEEYPLDSAGHHQDEAHYDCTRELLQYPGWEYVMYLQNGDIFLKTPEEISEIISVLNGTYLTSLSNPYSWRLPKSTWLPKHLKLLKNETQFSEEQRNISLYPRKSPNHMLLPRTFVQAVEDKLNMTEIFRLFNSVKYGVDEMLYATLLGSTSLDLPGQVEKNCTSKDYFRYVHWNWRNETKCKSFKKRHGVCLLGMEYIPILNKQPHIIANKIWPEWDFGAIMCMGEILYNRTNVDMKHKLDLKPYQELSQVREKTLKAQGKFNASTFKC